MATLRVAFSTRATVFLQYGGLVQIDKFTCWLLSPLTAEAQWEKNQVLRWLESGAEDAHPSSTGLRQAVNREGSALASSPAAGPSPAPASGVCANLFIP